MIDIEQKITRGELLEDNIVNRIVKPRLIEA